MYPREIRRDPRVEMNHNVSLRGWQIPPLLFFFFLLILFHLLVAIGEIVDWVSTADDCYSYFPARLHRRFSTRSHCDECLLYSAVVVVPTPFCYQLTAMTTRKLTATAKIPSQCQSQFELAGSAPAVSLDPRDYFYPSSIQGPSIWSIRMEQELVKAVSMTKVMPATSLLSDEPYSAGGTVPFPPQSSSCSILLHNWRAAWGIWRSCGRPNLALTHHVRFSLIPGDTQTLEQLGSDEFSGPSSSLECFPFEALHENSEKSSASRNSPRRSLTTSKSGLRSSGAGKTTTHDDEECPEMLVTSSSSLLGLIDSEVLGSNSHRSNIMNLGAKRTRKLSLQLDHKVAAACVNRALDVGDKTALDVTPALAPPAKKAAVEPSNSCESSQSPCNVAGLQAC